MAEEVLARNYLDAICHGDSHTRNVLIRGDQGFLIDYAYSGPGHPAVDLARLELSVFFTVVHPYGSTEDWLSLQRDISATELTASEILARHDHIMISEMNRLAIRMCVEARDACLRVLRERRLDRAHYTAAKLLFAWQQLMSPNAQQSLVRVVVESLAEKS